MDTQKERLMLMTRLAAAFPRDHVPQSTVMLYASETAELRLPELARVVNTSINNARKFPTIAELRADYRAERSRTPDEHAALPIGREPMPDDVREQIDDLFRKADERAAELEPETT